MNANCRLAFYPQQNHPETLKDIPDESVGKSDSLKFPLKVLITLKYIIAGLGAYTTR